MVVFKSLKKLMNIGAHLKSLRWFAVQTPRKESAEGFFSGKRIYYLAIPVLATGMSIYELKKWKQATLVHNNIINLMNAEPVLLPELLEELADMEYRPVRVCGTFDHSKELFLRGKKNQNAGPQTIGSHVITPLKLSDRSESILVNRGWVDNDYLDPSTRPDGQVEGEVVIIGYIQHSKFRPKWLKASTDNEREFGDRNVELMADLANTSPVYIDADEASTIPGGPIGGQQSIILDQRNVIYAITWLLAGFGGVYLLRHFFYRVKLYSINEMATKR